MQSTCLNIYLPHSSLLPLESARVRCKTHPTIPCTLASHQPQALKQTNRTLFLNVPIPALLCMFWCFWKRNVSFQATALRKETFFFALYEVSIYSQIKTHAGWDSGKLPFLESEFSVWASPLKHLTLTQGSSSSVPTSLDGRHKLSSNSRATSTSCGVCFLGGKGC